MRPAVHASILRNRSQRVRRVNRPHSFSMRRLLLLACIGALFFIPGIVLTIVGLEKTQEDLDAMTTGLAIMYQVVGPALTSLGAAFLFSSCVYYYCYGTGESNRLPRGSHQNVFQSSINSDNRHHHHHHHGHHGHHGHHNGSQLNTPDGSIRRLSFKDELHDTPQPSPLALEAEEHVPLAPADTETHDSPRPSSPSSPRARSAQEVNSGTFSQDERLVNGELIGRNESPV